VTLCGQRPEGHYCPSCQAPSVLGTYGDRRCTYDASLLDDMKYFIANVLTEDMEYARYVEAHNLLARIASVEGAGA
jgi:hypothetical protein